MPGVFFSFPCLSQNRSSTPEGELDEENENEAAVNDWAMGDGIDLEAHGDGSDGREGDGSEDGDDFPVMSSRWGGQVGIFSLNE